MRCVGWKPRLHSVTLEGGKCETYTSRHRRISVAVRSASGVAPSVHGPLLLLFAANAQLHFTQIQLNNIVRRPTAADLCNNSICCDLLWTRWTTSQTFLKEILELHKRAALKDGSPPARSNGGAPRQGVWRGTKSRIS